MNKMAHLIVIGAGPAGLSAAASAAEQGLPVTVLDEFTEPGGRMPGQYHEEGSQGWWIGKHVSDELITRCAELGVDIRCGVSVHGMEYTTTWEISTSCGLLTAEYVLLATGAAEIPVPLDGWTLPGVMSIGAAQVLTNVHYVKPGERGIIVGMNVLSMAIARELSVAGVKVAAITLPCAGPLAGAAADPTASAKLLLQLSGLAPAAWMRVGGKLAATMRMEKLIARCYPHRGFHLWDIPIRLRTAVQSVNGQDRVESVTLVHVKPDGSPIAGSERVEPADFVALSGGLYPLAELAAVAGCKFVYSPELGGHVPLHGERMETSLKGLYVAGNITGIESGLVAMAQGRLAAASMIHAAGLGGAGGEQRVQEAIREVHFARKHALIQFHPGITEARTQLYQQWGQISSGSGA
ncbi:NAD(P)/FAD-dependent oxidoreductase [Paenibacillus polymyxa]|uniref:NAD(P)/FAD-dependent oxidoreductase n=1 Tax=Paenibacillus polymyxa TaxID=1406 RepID=UPI001865A678|nr:FAD-dependent oxidoreductase [Paenibacillus polymyxa]MBE3648927.1 FAD-dependent oxidoreductase [Paenibacillus polymyxa]